MSVDPLRWTRAVALTVLGAAAAAQDVAATEADALAHKAEDVVVTAYLARAEQLHGAKQYGRALELRRELVQEWAPGNAAALQAMGFVRIGEQWRRDANAVVLDRDLKLDAKAQKKLDQDWPKTQKELQKAVERAAVALAAAGAQDRANVFWRRLLRLKPGDSKAASALQLPMFDGHAGTRGELVTLRRGRAIVQAVQFLQQWEPRVAIVEHKHALLDQCGLAYACAQTDHFRVFGTLAPDKLQLAARWAERALLLARTLLGAAGGGMFVPHTIRDIVWCADVTAYHRVLDACAGQFDAERLRFLKQDVDLAFVDVGGRLQRCNVLKEPSDDVLVDVTARGVVQDASGCRTDGLWEGLGHATCAFLFDRTLTFLLEQQHGDTVTSWAPKPLLPEMSAWREIAAESAWAKNDTPTSRLVLMEGYKFSNEERVKAWAMVDYLLRARPEFVLQLDASKQKDVKDPLAVEAAFLRRTGTDLRVLDDAWRDYWGKGESLRKAMAAAPKGAPAEVDAARAVVFAIDAARAAADVGPAGFVVAADDDCKAAHEWVQKLLRWEAAQKKEKDPKKKELAPPSPPVAVGATVLLHRAGEPAAAVAAWFAQPVVRDYLLHPGRRLFAASATKDSIALDLTAPAEAIERGLPQPWPRAGQRVASGRVLARDLGPGLAGVLAEAGVGGEQPLGLPLSLHFFRPLGDAERAEVTCTVVASGQPLDGALHWLQDGEGLRAAGCVAFVPISPLPSGEVAVQWTVPKALLAKDEKFSRLAIIVE